MTDQIQPALTSEEWKEFPCVDNLEMHSDGKVENNCCGCTMPKRHALAAACLHQQPYGFTQEDVELLRKVIDGCDGTIDAADQDRVFTDGIVLRGIDWRRLHSLATRIEALLPPKSIAEPTYDGEDGG